MLAEAKLDPDAQILTSRDPRSKKLKKLLETSNVPPGFKKYQLPFSFHKPSNQYMTVGKANAEVKSHAHEDGAGLRVVLEGSITYRGKVLKKGDWMYIPAGTAYAYRVGP